jgi:pyridoxal phosphate enzyme (YggS family)
MLSAFSWCHRIPLRPPSFIARHSQQLRMASYPADSVIVSNARIVQERAATAASNAGRSSSVRLVAVSKTKPVENIKELYDAGFRSFGENYFQELVEKAQALPTDIQWHFIGHLQSSKASKLIKEVPNLAVLETVDSAKLAGKLNNACEAAGRGSLDVFLQVDTSGEDTKSGVTEGAELESLLRYVQEQCPRLTIRGLMTIGEPQHLPDTAQRNYVSCSMRELSSRCAKRLHLFRQAGVVSGDRRRPTRGAGGAAGAEHGHERGLRGGHPPRGHLRARGQHHLRPAPVPKQTCSRGRRCGAQRR